MREGRTKGEKKRGRRGKEGRKKRFLKIQIKPFLCERERERERERVRD